MRHEDSPNKPITFSKDCDHPSRTQQYGGDLPEDVIEYHCPDCGAIWQEY
jgi:hypothetical protein